MDHINFQEWVSTYGDIDLPGPYAEREDPFVCIVCGATLVTCLGEHDGEPSQDPTPAIDHLVAIFRNADLDASARVAGIHESVRRDLDGDDGEYVEFEPL